MAELTEDEKAFGVSRWIYCKDHVGFHTTGWCTVEVDRKIALEATDPYQARIECGSKGLKVND